MEKKNGGTPVGGARLTWDANQMRKGLSRKIFATLQERAGHEVVLMEQVASELSRLVNPRNPGPGLQQLYAGFEDPEPIRHLLIYRMDPRETIQHQIWWAEEMHRPDGIYRVRLLNEEEGARYENLMESFATSGARRVLTTDQIREDPDSIILCQAAATGEDDRDAVKRVQRDTRCGTERGNGSRKTEKFRFYSDLENPHMQP